MALGGDAPPASLGSFAFKGDNGRAVTAPSLLDAAIPFVEQLFLKSLALVESEEVTPHEGELDVSHSAATGAASDTPAARLPRPHLPR